MPYNGFERELQEKNRVASEWQITDAEYRTLPLTAAVLRMLMDSQTTPPAGYPYVLVPPERYLARFFHYEPLEVFLIDARWFSRTEPSQFDPEQATLLGRQQWKWLRQSLLASTAPFKLLCTGMTWDDKQWDTDHWDSYPAVKTPDCPVSSETHRAGSGLKEQQYVDM
jgi:hypothetical protein